MRWSWQAGAPMILRLKWIPLTALMRTARFGEPAQAKPKDQGKHPPGAPGPVIGPPPLSGPGQAAELPGGRLTDSSHGVCLGVIGGEHLGQPGGVAGAPPLRGRRG